MKLQSAAAALALFGLGARGLEVQVDNKDSIKENAATIAWSLVKYYTGNNTGDTPGNLPDPYYWWEAGAMFGTLIDYWFLTGDDSYNDITKEAMIHQAGPTGDFMPDNQTLTEGNDDQGFWAMASMSAAENKFPNPPKDSPQWLAITQAVFNEYVSRWEPDVCKGGMRWQIFEWNNGYDYKNTISNGCFFNIAARLAKYTGNDTYSDWAEKIWNWHVDVKLITDQYEILDGIHLKDGGCGNLDTIQWTYNAGVFIHGAAFMYSHTKNETWKERTEGILKTIESKFFKNNVVYEQFCEESELCNNDQRSFKGYLIRWLAWVSKLIPDTADTIQPLIEGTTGAAGTSCSGDASSPDYEGHPGQACGFAYVPSAAYDNLPGVGEQMNALDAYMYLLMPDGKDPYTSSTGGNSKGDVNAGTSDSDHVPTLGPITTGDQVGAGFLTTLILAGFIGGCAFVVT